MFANTGDFQEKLSPEQQRVFKSTYGQSKDGKLCLDVFDRKWEDMPVEDMASRVLMMGCPSSCGKRERGVHSNTLGEIKVPELEGNMDYGFKDPVVDKLFPECTVSLPIGDMNVPPRGKANLEIVHRTDNYLKPGICSTLFQLYKRQYYTEEWCRQVSQALAANGMHVPFPLDPCVNPAEYEQKAAELAQ